MSTYAQTGEKLDALAVRKRMQSARQYCGVRSAMVPVELIADSDSPPVLTGTAGVFFTRGGDRISHPVAYARTGWSNMTYRTSTERISVGEKWGDA